MIHIERGSQYLRGAQIVVVDLSPVIYNPVRGQLNYYDQIEVTIQTQWQGRPAGVMPYRNLPVDRKQILRTIDNTNDFLLLNPAPASQGQSSLSPEKSSGGAEIVWPAARDYVVITTSAMTSAFTNLTNHRQSSAGGSFTTHCRLHDQYRIFFQLIGACYSGSIDGCGWGPGATYIMGDCVLEDMVNIQNSMFDVGRL